MKRFSILQVNCEGCGVLQDPKSWSGTCTTCGRDSFQVEIERSASGWESMDFQEFLAITFGHSNETYGDPYWSTQSFLECGGVLGDEIAEFCSATIEARRKMYIAWKRRDLEASLASGQKICRRCLSIFKAYKNEWNGQGFCSRSCWKAASKAKRALKK
jgi:hypothetical protein